MKPYKVIIPPIVQEQVFAQVLHIARDSVDNALAWEDRLRAAIKAIGRTPLGHPVDDATSERLGQVVRKVVFERTYLVFYRVNQKSRTIDIIHFRHGARLPRPGEA